MKSNFIKLCCLFACFLFTGQAILGSSNISPINLFENVGLFSDLCNVGSSLSIENESNSSPIKIIDVINRSISKEQNKNTIIFNSNDNPDSIVNGGPKDIVINFLNALNERDFVKAYGFCSGKRWGSLDFFSSKNSYGGINSVEIINIDSAIVKDNSTAHVVVVSQVNDPINGNGLYEQDFQLKLMNDQKWSITEIKLISSNRPQDNWNLNQGNQLWITDDQGKSYINYMYSRIFNRAEDEDPSNKMVREIQPLYFFKAENEEYALAVVENQGPDYGSSVGHCDLFLFTKKNSNLWALSDFLLKAGGGGMYGYSGAFERVLRIGKHSAGIVISGGQTHMGSYFFDDIILVRDGKLTHLLNVGRESSYGNWDDNDGYKLCEQLEYKFIKSEKEMYDLQLKRIDCLGVKKPTNQTKISFENNKYVIPNIFYISN